MTAPAAHDSPTDPLDHDQPVGRPAAREHLATYSLFGKLIAVLVALALATSAAALVLDATPVSFAEAAHATVSPAPLFLIGAAFLTLQVWLRPGFGALLKRAMVALAFLLWGVVQLLPSGTLAAALGDIVIALFVVDLAIVIRQETQGDKDEAL